MWEGGKGSVSEGLRGVFETSSVCSPLWTAGGGGAEAGSATGGEVSLSGAEGSTEWRFVTGVILFGGVGGERLAGAGTVMKALPACECSAGRRKKNSRN